MRVFLTHNPEDLDAYFGRALPQLESLTAGDGLNEVAVEVSVNPTSDDLSTADLIAASADHDIIIAHRATPGHKQLFEQSPQLVAMFRTAVDISTIDVEAASANGVLVAHADKSFVPSTAELALGLLLDTARNIASSTADYRSKVNPPQRPGRQLRGQVAGIIGCGAIGSYLARLLVAVGMDVVVCDPFLDVAPDGCRLVDFASLLKLSDVVFPLAQASPTTVDLIDAAALAAMKPGATLINVSRGELVNEPAVFAALESGHLGALGIDVGWAPDQRPSPELASHRRVVATPHLGGLTPENADAQALSAVEQVAAILAGDVPPRSVNADRAYRFDEFRKARC